MILWAVMDRDDDYLWTPSISTRKDDAERWLKETFPFSIGIKQKIVAFRAEEISIEEAEQEAN